MDISVIIISLSVAVQLTAAFFAIRLLMQPGRRIAGLLTLTIIMLMAFRRFISFYRLITGGVQHIDLFAETIALSISFLILVAILYLYRLIQSERKMALMLEDSKQHYQTLFNQSPDGVLLIDLHGHIIEFNDTAARDLGYAREEFSRLNLSDLDPIETPEEIQRSIKDILRKGKAEFEVKHRTKGGDVRDVQVITQVVESSGERVLHTIWRDITERKLAERALSEKESFLAESQRIAHIGSWEHNLTTGKVVWSDELFRILGLDPRKDQGDFKIFFDMIHPADRPALKKAIDETVRTGKHFSIDYRINLRDGRTRILHAEAERISDETGMQTILSGTGQDITEYKQVEEKIRQSEEFVRSILDTVDEGFIVIDRDFRILTANKAYCTQTGVPCEDVIGKNCYEITHKTNKPCYDAGEDCAVRRTFETGEPQTAFHKHPDPKGSILYVETKAFPIKNSTGVVTSVIETVNNITEKHLLKEEQLKTQKLEAIGTLAGGIAHDFNNLLQGVFGYISMAKIMHDQKQKSLDMLDQAEKALHMSVNLTSQLLTFSKGGKPLMKRIALRPVIENSAKFALSGSRVDYRLLVDEELWTVEADEGQIGQVIQNLVLNAEQAMPIGGTINIMTKNIRSRQKGLPPVLQQGNYVVISIKDSGIGIPEQYLPRIFDPYFTTKDKGSGLGLATSYSIIKNHGGLIDVKSKLSEGTTFSVYLPAVEALETSAVTIHEDIQALRRGRILVMDDEELIRNIATEMLRSLGHEVELAGDGEEAIAKYLVSVETGMKFDTVILDLTIRGGMGGEEVIKELLQIDPDIKAIVSSGYTDRSTISEYKTIGFQACLTKPYNIKSLNGVLNSLLD